ncbi:hypothetical protein [Clostridium sp. Marseille-Q2269]|uniref:hypothetical protein n=1 Tax=Clostridium sp. Marseille-Q2269 TaxID=2942205 RepID=UPI0020744530|nr:hypothetical protein [Clostridium sp. Marseille-Q2269]
MFDLIATGISASIAAPIVDMILNGVTIASALYLVAGLAGGAAFALEKGLSALIKWAGRKTIINW